jgi:DNA polymerase-3 subunit beta
VKKNYSTLLNTKNRALLAVFTYSRRYTTITKIFKNIGEKMNLVINKAILENILSNMQSFIDKKDISQITSHIYFECSENQLTIKATDYEIGLKTQISNLTIHTSGNATVNGKKILEIIKRLKDEELILKTESNNLIITQNHAIFKLPMFEASEFPTFPSIENKPKIEIDSINLIQSLKKITPTIDNNNPKVELNGAFIDIKETLINIVATDTKRLSIISLSNNSSENLSLIIPKRAIAEIQKIFFDKLDIFYDEVHLIIKSQNYEFFTKQINGKFPDYERIIPQNSQYNLELPKTLIVDAIKLINSISTNLKISFKNDTINFESISDENSEAKIDVEYQTNIDNFEFAVNSRYLLDFLSSIDEANFKIELNEPNLPFVVESNGFKTIIMPIVL